MNLRRRACLLLLIMLWIVTGSPADALDNGLARTPPMGWNSWNRFRCNVDETLIKGMADALVSSGLRDAGYVNLVIDDCWQKGRDEQGNIIPDPARFPSGMKALADFVHARKLKFGIYSDAGTATCQGRPGSRGYEFQDARQYAAWGVDYLKYDWCNHGTQNSVDSYSLMRDALAKAGRPITYSICEWGSTQPWLWAGTVGNLWRTTTDIADLWDGTDSRGHIGVVRILDQQASLASYAGPGGWNDPDMLQVGNGGMTATEYRSHFSMWAIMAAPLIAGNDLTAMTEDTRNILLNREVIAIDQDPLGAQGQRVRKDGNSEVWSKQLADGGRAVALLNRGAAEAAISVAWTEIGYPGTLQASVRDVWAHSDAGTFRGSYSAKVPSHGVVLVTLKP